MPKVNKGEQLRNLNLPSGSVTTSLSHLKQISYSWVCERSVAPEQGVLQALVLGSVPLWGVQQK